jgi:hypothetical protein
MPMSGRCVSVYLSLSHKGHGGLLDPYIWSTCIGTNLDLAALESWLGFMRRADLFTCLYAANAGGCQLSLIVTIEGRAEYLPAAGVWIVWLFARR